MDAALRQATPFGKYVLLERVSVGGMAEVFKAKAFGVEGFEKILAIKRILPSMAEDADFIEMFIDEAKICGQLNHANICQIYELGRVADSHFIAMEYVWGKDVLQMQNRFRKLRQKMKPEMAAYITCRICEGLDYAHKKKDATGKPLGIIHRDISPQNILVSYEGELKIIDFGIAKAASRSSKTQAGVLKGKFGYMSPEQVRGLPLDRRSDIFAIGTILYELLTAERLFHGDSDFETLEKVRNVDVPLPTAVNPGIPKALEKIIMRALSKDTETRYQWASEMAEELNGFLLAQDPAFSAQNLSQWMREQFAVEMRRERLVLDEQQKVTREVLVPAAANPPRPAQKSSPKLPAQKVAPPTKALRAVSALHDPEDDDGFDEKTTVSGPEFGQPMADPALPEQSTRIIDGGASPLSAPIAGQATVVFSDPSGQSRMPSLPGMHPSPLDAQPFIGPAGDPSLAYPPGASFTPHYGQLMPPIPPNPPRSSVWKDILIGVVVAGVVVGGILGARKYLANRGQATLALVSASGGGEVLLDGSSRGSVAPGSPLTLKGLPSGEHTIVVRGGESGDFKQTVNLAPGDVDVITVSFVAPGGEAGKLRLEIEAPGATGAYAASTADVYIDGAQLSTEASSTPISLRAGAPHEVRVQKTGMTEQRFTVEIKANETMVRPVHLIAATGKIVVTSEPPGAEVSVNGRRIGLTPTSASDLDAQHSARVSLRLTGYQPTTKNVSFETGPEQSLDVRLLASKEAHEGETEVAPKTEHVATKEKDHEKDRDKDKEKPPVKNTTSTNVATTAKKGTPVKPSLPSGDGIAAVSFGDPASGSDGEPGYLIASTQPFAKVFVDGKDTGKSTPIAPRSKLELKPGKHIVTFVIGTKKYPYEVTVKSGEETRLIRQLEAAGP